MKTFLAVCALAFLPMGFAFAETGVVSTADERQALCGSLTAFAVDAYSKAEKGEANFFFSPISVSIGLAMVYGGARGETETELAKAMQTDLGQARYHTAFAEVRDRINASLMKSRVRLSVAKLVAVQTGYPLQETFVSLAKEKYGSEILQLDFHLAPSRARGTLNSWVEKETMGKIREFIGDGTITQETKLAILNAIYFKASWASVFSSDVTKNRPFWITKTQKIETPTMYQREEFAYGEFESAQVLELPYIDGAVSMVIVLPKEPGGLAALEDGLTAKDIVKWTSLLAPPGKYEVETYLPKFEMEMDMDLGLVLSGMGVRNLFSPVDADLSAISTQGPLFVSAALHRAGVKVDEKGTEAWAATGYFVSLGVALEPPPRKVFRVDHPFLFFIMDKTNGVILFIGRVMNPKK